MRCSRWNRGGIRSGVVCRVREGRFDAETQRRGDKRREDGESQRLRERGVSGERRERSRSFARTHKAEPYATDTTGLRALRRPGLRGLIAVRIPAASDLVGIYEDVGAVLITFGTSSVPSFRLSTSVSDGAAIGAIRTPPGVIRSNGRSSRRSPPRRGTTVRLVRAYRKSVPPHMQRLLASKKTCCGRTVWCARPLTNFTVTLQFRAGAGEVL
jgi:hypothetical protein